jgi:hypothetical protein
MHSELRNQLNTPCRDRRNSKRAVDDMCYAVCEQPRSAPPCDGSHTHASSLEVLGTEITAVQATSAYSSPDSAQRRDSEVLCTSVKVPVSAENSHPFRKRGNSVEGRLHALA